jgi:hypothetical protein
MKRKFYSLTEVEEMGYTILDVKDIPAIEECLKEEIDVYVTDDLRIESEAGKYLADVAYEEKF